MKLVLVILGMALSLMGSGCVVCHGSKGALGDREAVSKSDEVLQDQIYFVLDKRNDEIDRWGRLALDMSPRSDSLRLDARLLPLLVALMRDRDELFMIRQEAVALLPRTADPISIDFLIEAMGSDSRQVALIAIEKLTFLLPIKIGVVASAPLEERQEAAVDLQQWWNANRDSYDVPWEYASSTF